MKIEPKLLSISELAYLESINEELLNILKELMEKTDKDYCVFCGNYKHEGHSEYCIFKKAESIIEKVEQNENI